MSRLEELVASELTKMLKSKLEALWKNEVASSMTLSGNSTRAAPSKAAAAASKEPMKEDSPPLLKAAVVDMDFEEWLEQPAFPVELEKRREIEEQVHHEPSPPARIMRVTSPTPATAMTSEAPEKKERGDSSPVNEDRRAPPKKEPTTEDESEKKDGGGLPPEERTLKPTEEAGWPPCRRSGASPSRKEVMEKKEEGGVPPLLVNPRQELSCLGQVVQIAYGEE
ncbi:unnamed protein product [Linum tenue]|uniref:Uncharacterized protein n=1 Tax=Linum tenue TaxID=586396 RepID=A0AAV0M9X2_9ROSI|nr:unnamed protein product [Linum tenue]